MQCTLILQLQKIIANCLDSWHAIEGCAPTFTIWWELYSKVSINIIRYLTISWLYRTHKLKVMSFWNGLSTVQVDWQTNNFIVTFLLLELRKRFFIKNSQLRIIILEQWVCTFISIVDRGGIQFIAHYEKCFQASLPISMLNSILIVWWKWLFIGVFVLIDNCLLVDIWKTKGYVTLSINIPNSDKIFQGIRHGYLQLHHTSHLSVFL